MAGRCRAQKTVEKGVGGGDKQCIHRRRHVRYHSGSPFTKGKHLAGRAWCDHGIDSQIYLIGYHGSAPSGSFHGGFPDVVFAYRRATLSRVDLAGQPPVGSTRDPLAARRLTLDGSYRSTCRVDFCHGVEQCADTLSIHRSWVFCTKRS